MRRHAHVDFQLFSQKSSGIPVDRSAKFQVIGMTRHRKKSPRELNPGSVALEADALTTGPARRSEGGEEKLVNSTYAMQTRPGISWRENVVWVGNSNDCLLD